MRKWRRDMAVPFFILNEEDLQGNHRFMPVLDISE